MPLPSLKVPSFFPFTKASNSSTKACTERHFRSNDNVYNAQFSYAGNYIRTFKYSIITFLPINLFEQFQRAANLYFLLQIVIMSIPQLTALNPLSTVIPLLFVLLATAVKDAYDDYGRHVSDNTVNNRLAQVVSDGKVVLKKWHSIGVGDVIKIDSDEAVTADIMLLSTSEPNGLCYIETAELDGETNLKVKQPLATTAKLEDNVQALSSFNGEMTCEPPNNVLDKFEGTLEWNGEKHAVDNNNVVLRGCWLRNTDWIFGVVIFAGHDTKLMMNSGATTFKRTKLDLEMNVLVIGIACLLLVICTFLSIMSYVWERGTGDGFQVFIPWPSYYKNSPGLIAVFHWPAFIMVLNTLIPISLYISVEIIRLGQSLLINWDIKMYHEASDTPARARNTTLNEELGQIQYIFSDKTGTLTQNMMTFKECSIGGKVYGHMIEDEDGNVRLDSIKDGEDELDAPVAPPQPLDLSKNVYADPKFVFYDNNLMKAIESGNEAVSEFFKLISLCHTVMIDEKKKDVVDGNALDEVDYIPCGKGQGKVPIEYQAQSPDEGALVSAARNFGFVFKHRTPNTITILNQEKEEVYELLAILDFNNVRKRMSVLVRKDDRVILYCKGADTIICERLSESCKAEMMTTQNHLDLFACAGLRTLCLAYREIDEKMFKDWWSKYHEASTALQDREEKVSAVYEEIEQDMTLLGATAIEDKLQDGVPETIANLAQADIKIWVLTGDKQETAINIGYSCMLLTEDLIDVFILNGNDAQTVRKQMQSFMAKIREYYPDQEDVVNNGDNNVIFLRTKKRDDIPIPVRDELGVSDSADLKEGFGLVVTGKSLSFALAKDVEQEFLALGKACKAVICCRVTPLQKALVVDLVKRHVKAVTLAIGDGANDVSMIKAAHIGVGISGQEGMQAVLASDHSIAQFRFLERLVLVHGRWSYLRMCKFLNYFFYKNFAFTLVQFWFNLFNGFSAQTLYDTWFMSFYNVTFTSLPVLALGIMDQDVSEKNCVEYPKLYLPGPKNILFNRKTFALKLLHGAVTSLLLYFIPYGILKDQVNQDGLDVGDIKFVATTIACTLVILVNLQIGLDTSHWTWINHFFVWGSVSFYFIFTFTLYSPGFSGLAPGIFTFSGIAVNVFGSGLFWFSLFLTLAVCLLPVIGFRWGQGKLMPTLSDLVRRGEWKERRNIGQSLVSLRRSRRSIRSGKKSSRSGYAFSHQQGFGELIMSGKWLPKFKLRTSKTAELSP